MTTSSFSLSMFKAKRSCNTNVTSFCVGGVSRQCGHLLLPNVAVAFPCLGGGGGGGWGEVLKVE